MIHWVLCRMRLSPASACRMPAGTARAKPRSPPSRNFNGLVIVRGRAAQSVARVMKKAMPCVMSSKAVTISPDATFRNTGCPWSLSRWCDHTVPQAHPEDLGHHVDEDEHSGEQDDDRVEGHVDGSAGDRDDRKRDEEVGVLAAPPATEQIEQT